MSQYFNSHNPDLRRPFNKTVQVFFLDLRQKTFEEIPGLVDIVDVAAGLRHAAAVDKVPHSDIMTNWHCKPSIIDKNCSRQLYTLPRTVMCV